MKRGKGRPFPRDAPPNFPRARVLHLHEISTALLPPRKARWRCLHRRRAAAGLRARHAAKRDTTASTLIHAIVTVCTRWIRRIADRKHTSELQSLRHLV